MSVYILNSIPLHDEGGEKKKQKKKNLIKPN